MTTTHVRDGGGYEQQAGYARAVRRGSRVEVSGTTASTDDGTARHPGDTYRQTRDALRRALAALDDLDGDPTDVVRTRLFLTPEADWQDAVRAHRELLGDIAPANTTLYVHALIGDGLLVEVEVAAELRADRPTG